MPIKSNLPDLDIPDQSLTDLILEKLPHYGNDVALVDVSFGEKSLTFKEARNRICSCAGFLHKQGLKKGDVVGLCAPTCIEFPIAMCGIMAAGGVLSPCNPDFTKGEVRRLFSITEPKMVFVHESVVHTLKQVAEELSCIEKIFVIGKSDDFPTFETITESVHERDFPKNMTFTPSKDLAILPSSSGTTGMPKCIMHTHKSMVAMVLIWGFAFKWDKTLRLYMDRPMFHVSGWAITLSALVSGAKLFLEKEFQVEKMLADIEKHKITDLIAIPSMMIELANLRSFENYDTSSLARIFCGGANLSPSIMTSLMMRSNVQIKPKYGMTELAPITINDDTAHFLTSEGPLVPNTIVKIIELNTGDEVGANHNGEILVKGPQMMKGYFKNPEATKQTIDEDGWIHTGDLGHFDEHGMLYVIDRLKEVIKYKAVQVSPAELENVILKHPKVADVGVIGIPDALDGEHPKAFVVKKDESLSKKEITQLVQSELSDYKQLRGGVNFCKKIPKSATGKIQRGEMKKWPRE